MSEKKQKTNKRNILRDKMLSNPIVKNIVNITNITQLLHHIKKEYGKYEAVMKNDGTIVTFNDLYKDVVTVAHNLKDVTGNVGLFAPNSYEFMVVALAVMTLGKMVVCLPAALKKEQLFGCCQKFDVTLLCYHPKLIAASTLNINKVEIATLFKGKNIKDDVLNENIQDRDPACLLLTGGTTGAPKGVVLSHTAIMRGAINGCYGINDVYHERYYCMIPLTHSFGFIRNMLCALYTGSVIYFNQDKMLMFKELATFKPTVLIVVPAIAELFLSLVQSRGKEILGGKVKVIICGSANVPEHLSLEFWKEGIGFHPGYGSTELSNMVTGNIAPTQFPQAVGILFPEQEAKVVEGELWIKGRNLMNGYYKDPIANQEAFRDGWFKTGDLVRFDEYDNIYIVGRIKDLIVLDNGEKVSPAYLEAKVLKIDLVKDALVYAEKNSNGATNLILEVTLREGFAQKLNIKDVQEYLEKEVDKINDSGLPHERINKVIIRKEDFPRSPAMKILRKK